MLGRGAAKPRTIVSDRGPGFFHRYWGTITGDYEAAIKRNGFVTLVGSNATEGPGKQPADIADVLLHETAISWLKMRMARMSPTVRKPWEETPAQYAVRLKGNVSDINKTCGGSALSGSFLRRMEALAKKGGGRLKY